MPINPLTGKEEEEKLFTVDPLILEAQEEQGEEIADIDPEILEAQAEIPTPSPEGASLTPLEIDPDILEAKNEIKRESSQLFQTLTTEEKQTDPLTEAAGTFRSQVKAFEESENKKEKQRQFLFEEGFTSEEVPQELFPSDKPKELKTTFERFGDFVFPEKGFSAAIEQESFEVRASLAKEQKNWVDSRAPEVYQRINQERTNQELEPLDLNREEDREVFYSELNNEFGDRFDQNIETADGWFALLTIPASFWNGAIISMKGSAILGAQELGGLAVITEIDEAVKTRELPDGSDLLDIGMQALTGAAFGALPGAIGQGVTKVRFGRATAKTAKILSEKTGQKVSPSDIANMAKRYSEQYDITKEVAMKQLGDAATESLATSKPFRFGSTTSEAVDGGTDLWTMVNSAKIRKDVPKFNDIAGFTEQKLLNKSQNQIVGGAPVGGRAGAVVDDLSDDQLRQMFSTIVHEDEELTKIIPELDKYAFPLKEAKKFYTGNFSDQKAKNLITRMIRSNKVLSDDEAKKVISFQTLAKEANEKDGSLTIKAIYDNVLLNDGASIQSKNVREAVLHVLQSRSTAEDHMVNHVAPLMEAFKRGDVTRDVAKNALKMNLAIIKQADDVGSEIGRSLNAMKIKTNSIASVQRKIFKQIEEVVDDPSLFDDIADRLVGVDIMDPFQRHKFLMGLRKATTKEKIEELWFNSILSGPATQFRNIMGNTIFGGVMEFERLTATAIEKGLAAGGRALGLSTRSSRTFSEAFSAWGAFGRGLMEGFDNMSKSIKTGVPVFQATKQSDFSVKTGQAIGGKVGTVLNIPSRTLQGADDLFKSVHYRMEVAAGARREALERGSKLKLTSQEIDNEFKILMEAPTDEIRQRAIHRALVGTFTKQGNKASKAITAVREAIPGGKYVIPFVRTPMNIAGETVVRTPLGAVNTIGKLYANGGRMSLSEFSDDMAKLVTGGLIGSGMYMATEKMGIQWNGGGPEQGGERDLFLSSFLPYSFTLPDGTSIGFKNIEPLSGILGIMADLKGLHDNGLENIFTADTVITVSRAVSSSVTEKTFGQGFQTFIDIVAPKDRTRTEQLGRRIGQTLTGFIPYSGLLRTVDRIHSADNPQPRKKTSTNIKSAFLQEASKVSGPFQENIEDIFGVDFKVEEMETIFSMWGEPVIPGGVLDNGYIDNILLPFRRKDVAPANQLLNREIIEWTKLRPDAEISGLSSPSRTMSFAKQEWKLPAKEWEAFTQEEGQRAKAFFLDIFQEPWWQGLPVDEKIRVYNKFRNKIRKQVKEEFISNGLEGQTENIITLPEQLTGQFRNAPTEEIGKHLEEITFE